MGYLVQLKNYRPAERYDDVAWSSVLIEEGPTSSGPWAEIDSQALNPVDTDPAAPTTRSFTTTQATQQDGLWYRVTFLDPADNQQAFKPAFNASEDVMPAATEIRSEHPAVPWAEWGFPQPGPTEYDPLEGVLAEAVAQLTSLIGPVIYEPVDDRAPLVRLALKMLVIYECGGRQAEKVESVIDFDILSSFNAGSYSETRRDIGPNASVLHPWPDLNRLLLGILNFANAGKSRYDGAAIEVAGPTPMPGSWYMGETIVPGAFDPPITMPIDFIPDR